MYKRCLIVILLLGVFVLAGCDIAPTTSDRASDPQAAQQYFPQLGGYNVTQTDNIQSAIATAAGGAGVLTGNPVQAAMVAQIDSIINCYRDVGAVDARIYIENITIDNVRIPTAGVLAVINEDRLRDNFLACVARTPLDGRMSPQSVQPEPCFGSGSFTHQDNRISYLYAATDTPLCSLFSQHFAQFGG